MEQYKEDYRQKIEEINNPENLNIHEIDVLATQYANDEIRREQRHLKAYIGGKTHYKYLKKKHIVITEEILENRRKMDEKYLRKNEEEE